MKRWIGLLALLISCSSMAAAAYEAPPFKAPTISDVQLGAMNGLVASSGGALWLPDYWFADGFLTEGLQGGELYLENHEAILLYSWPDGRATPTGYVAVPGRMRLLAIGCWTWPELTVITARQPLKINGEGAALQKFGYLSAIDEQVAVYSQGRVLLLPRDELQGPLPTVSGEGGQWLYLRDAAGVAGWTPLANGGWQVVSAADGRGHLANYLGGKALKFSSLPRLKVAQ